MSELPTIGVPGESDDFHDSSLVDFQISPGLDELRVILSTPDEDGVQRLWLIIFSGLLRIEFERSSTGSPRLSIPLEIYSVYEDVESEERQRWARRLREVEGTAAQARHIVLASSTARGWGSRASLEGVEVVCRNFRIEPAPRDYLGSEFTRPRIPG